MRIGIVSWTAREVGGAERYLSTILPPLGGLGHQLGMLVEMDRPAERERIALPPGSPVWSCEEVGVEAAMAGLGRWGPDVVFVHITLDPEVERAAQAVAPAVLFAHAYYGTCISGTKTRSFPYPTPCDRVFGPGCLANFYPRRCGGLSPLTMLRDYRKQSARNGLFPGYERVVTNSTHMRDEFVRNGVAPGRAVALPMPIEGSAPLVAPPLGPDATGDGEVRLLMAGRMDDLKGGIVALDALPLVRGSLRRPVRLVMVGDGPRMGEWREHARRVEAADREVRVEFTGWVSRESLDERFAAADLLLVPSLWPEPFGLVGPEAGRFGLPAVAFPVGGIPDWLHDGINGHFAMGKPNTHRTLADAAVRALADPDHLLALRRGAREVARQLTLDRHLSGLTEVLVEAAAGRRAGSRADGAVRV